MKELSHFPNSQSKGIAETDRKSEQENLMMSKAGITFFHLQNIRMH